MNASTKTHAAYFNYIGSIELPLDVARACSHPGPCDDDVQRAMELPEVKAELSEIDPEELRKELKEYGAWTAEQLADHDENLQRILWIAAGNIMDELHTTGQTWPLGQSLPEPYQVGYNGPGWEYKPYPQPEPFKPSGEQAEEWSIGSGDDYLNVMIQDRKGNNIAEVICPFEADKPLVDKRARVIAAAPDLLKALQDIVHAHDVGMGKSAVQLRIEIAKDTIKKAQP